MNLAVQPLSYHDFLFDNLQDFSLNTNCGSYRGVQDYVTSENVIDMPKNVSVKTEEIDFDNEFHPVLDYEDFSHGLDLFQDELFTQPAKRLKVEENGRWSSVPAPSSDSWSTSTGVPIKEEESYCDMKRKTPPSLSVPTSGSPKKNHKVKNFTLVMGQQPAPSVVYKRIVKPFPAVMLMEENPFNKTSKLFVDCVLIREDNGKVADILEGNQPLPISNGSYTVFKKLKIKETSRVHKTKFKLKFRLVQSMDKKYIPINTIFVTSEPITVYSHSSYVSKNRRKNTGPPVVTDVLPPVVSKQGGTRCVIIGSNFVKSKHLKVKLGDVEIKPTFHESGTLVFTTPALESSCKITVANDAENFSQSDCWITVSE